jgi:hypothetical protein
VFKQFIKTLPTHHPIATELMDQFGKASYTDLVILLELAQDIGPFELTPAIMKKECGLHSSKIEKIFENFKNIFEQAMKFLKISEDFGEISGNFAKTEGGNPRGCNKSIKREREEREKDNIASTQIDLDFDVWYKTYPNRKASGEARKAYRKAREIVSAETLLEGVLRYRAGKPHYADWKLPATWLNKECWKDEYDTTPVEPSEPSIFEGCI